VIKKSGNLGKNLEKWWTSGDILGTSRKNPGEFLESCGKTCENLENWLAVWNMIFIFHILGIIIPTDFHIFQRGRSTTNHTWYLDLMHGFHSSKTWFLILYRVVFFVKCIWETNQEPEIRMENCLEVVMNCHCRLMPSNLQWLGFTVTNHLWGVKKKRHWPIWTGFFLIMRNHPRLNCGGVTIIHICHVLTMAYIGNCGGDIIAFTLFHFGNFSIPSPLYSIPLLPN
jgi:hypothetical protein